MILALYLVLAIPAILPLFTHGYPSTDDGDLHLMRQAMLDYHIRQGNWYPRWTPELFLGYGYPVFHFYGPATYYWAELFIGLGLPVVQAVIATSALLVLLGGCGMLFFATDYFATREKEPDPTIAQNSWGSWSPNPLWGGLVAAVAYTYAPYFLTNLYVRGALAELGAMALWPWVLWSCRRLFTNPHPQRYLFVTALTLAAIPITHTITLLLAPPVVLLYALLLLWQRQRQRNSVRPYLLSGCVAALGAVGISAFFWLPLVVERSYIGRLAYSAKFMPGHFWDWHTFLDSTLFFEYSGHPPHQLGLIQVALVLAGLYGFWRQQWESRFWLSIAAIALFAISRPTMPLWMESDIGLIIQFPWRLLGIVSAIFALMTGSVIALTRHPWLQMGVALLTIALIIVSSRPIPAALDFRQAQDIDVPLDVVATFEQDAQAWGAGWSREFLPKWAEAFARVETTTRRERQSIFSAIQPSNNQSLQLQGPNDQLAISLQSATPYQFVLEIVSPAPTQLYFNQFYFPGWQIHTENGEILRPVPSPEMGLLTVEVPASPQTITVARTSTRVQWWATFVTAGTLLAFTGWLLLRRWWGQAGLAASLLAVLLGAWVQPTTNSVHHFTSVPAAPSLGLDGLDLLGYRAEEDQHHGLLLFPYWYIRNNVPDLQLTWMLTDQEGTIVSSVDARPYFDTIPSSVWQPGSVIRDGYRLPLPPNLAAGTYQLAVRVRPADGPEEAAELRPEIVGAVSLQAQPAMPAMLRPLDLTFTLPEQVIIWLDSDETTVRRPLLQWLMQWRQRPVLGDYAVAYPGERLVTRLYWRAERPAPEGYHSFIHLVSHARQTLVAQDQLAGSALNSSLTWNRYRARGETYALVIPAMAASGLYYPRVGLYTFEEQERFTIYDRDGNALGDGYDLPPLKIVNPRDIQPLHTPLFRFGDFAQLIDARVEPEVTTQANPHPTSSASKGGALFPPRDRGGLGWGEQLLSETHIVQEGDTLKIYLTYQARQVTATDYTQFVHLARTFATGEVEMATQFDGKPQSGGNPTNAWVPSEVIQEEIALTVAENTPPGRYQLTLGLYDDGGNRAVVSDATGATLLDNAIPLAEIEVESR